MVKINIVIISIILVLCDAKTIDITKAASVKEEKIETSKENIIDKTEPATNIEIDFNYDGTKANWSKFDLNEKVDIDDDVEEKSNEEQLPKPANEEPIVNRQKRFLFVSLLQHHMFEVMRMSPSHHYVPLRPHDAFDILRDNYLPPIGGVQKSYDFVVVGAGSAGSVIASRLSEDGRYSVLLLEAGGPEDLFTQVPLLAAYFQSTNYNWGYKMEKHERLCTAMKDQRCSWPKGRAIGGSSVINYMIYTRGHRTDWDRIAADGNPGWSFDDVFPYFLKSEGAQNLEGLEYSKNHSKIGLLGVEYAPYKSILVKAFLKAAKQKGHSIVDYNNGDAFGFSRVQTNTRHGWRHSAAKAFLSPFKTRRSLHVLPFSRVTKINVKNSTKTATSVEYIRNGIKYRVKAKKEIILSAGTFSSAQLLMLSGIGPKQHLEELDIPVIKDLPVGKIMYDHFCFYGLQFLVNCSNCAIIESNILNVENILNWFKFGKGPMTMIGGVEGIGYIKTNISEETGNYPDAELLFISGGIVSDASRAIMQGMNIDKDFFDEVYGDIVEKPVFTIIPMLLHPKSKGHMKLRDKNPLHWPKFYYDYFSERKDLETLLEAIKHIIELSKTKALQKFGAKLHDTPYPNCDSCEFGSDEYWECALRSLGSTLHHQIGSCKMGPTEDPEAVVDNELRVHGIKRLRVGDASIIPRPIGAHMHAPSVMIGERLADFLKETWS